MCPPHAPQATRTTPIAGRWACMSLAMDPVVVAAGTRNRQGTSAPTFRCLRRQRCRETPSPAARKAAVRPRTLPSFRAPAQVGAGSSNILTTAHLTLVQPPDRLTGRLSDAPSIPQRKATFKNNGRYTSFPSLLFSCCDLISSFICSRPPKPFFLVYLRYPTLTDSVRGQSHVLYLYVVVAPIITAPSR